MIMKRPLDGFKIIEVSSMVAAPYCGKILAELGAEVIKVEEPKIGDEARRRGPFFENVPEPDNSVLFFYMNMGKLGITLDIRQPKGRDVFYRLIQEADVLIEDIAPIKKREFGLHPQDIEKIESKLVHISITPLGMSGPYKDFKTHHLNRFMAGGDGGSLFVSSKYVADPPIQGPAYFVDYEAGWGAAVAILGACFHRHRSGRGNFIDFSTQEWCLALNHIYLAKYPNQNILMDRSRMEFKCGGLMECKDGHLMVILLVDQHWSRFAKVMGDPPWAYEERFDSQVKRVSQGTELNALIQEWARNFSKEELYHKLQAAGIPAVAVFSPAEVMMSAQLASRKFFYTQDHPLAGKLTMPSMPYQFSRWEFGNPKTAPHLGEHNGEVFGRLGLTEKEIGTLRIDGVV
jgi:CoA:oxalate CoA-transferase